MLHIHGQHMLVDIWIKYTWPAESTPLCGSLNLFKDEMQYLSQVYEKASQNSISSQRQSCRLQTCDIKQKHHHLGS